MIQSGRVGRFHWLVATSCTLPSLNDLTVLCHPGLRLCITSCDSGPLVLSPEERADGWESRGKVAVSPPLVEGLAIPCDQYDEWYLLKEPSSCEWRPETFVNYGGFTVIPAEELVESGALSQVEWLAPLQVRFWEQLERVNPVSYIATGDHDVVVSQRLEFIERLRLEHEVPHA